MKKIAARQAWDDEQIARAVEYTTCRFQGRGSFDTRRFADLSSALADAKGDRAAIVYAVTPEGFTIHIINGDQDMTHLTPSEDFALTSPEAVAADLDSAAQDAGFASNADAVAASEADATPAPKARKAKAPKAAKAKAPKAAKAPAAPKAPKAPKAPAEPKLSKRAQAASDAQAAAEKGTLPTPPDFTAATHNSYRKKLEGLIEAAKKNDIAHLTADTTEPKCSSRIPLCRYRDLAIVAVEARLAKKEARAAS